MKISVFWKKTDKIALALSGGVDSIVLLDLLLTTYRDSYKELVIFHINHGLREQSNEEEQFILNFAKENNISVKVAHLHLKEYKKEKNVSEEMLARSLRYASFEKMAQDESVNILLTAHHKNDNVENVIMRILSGRAITSNLLIEEKINIGKLIVVRPLLKQLKSNIVDYANSKKLKYYEDETNYNTKDYTRNYIRHKIVPQMVDLDFSSLDNLIKFASYYQNLKNNVLNLSLDKICSIKLNVLNDKVSFFCEDFFMLNTIEKEQFLYNILKKYFEKYSITRNSLSNVIADLTVDSGNVEYYLKKDLKIIKEYQSISICKIEKKCYNDKIVITKDSIKENICYDFRNNKLLITKESDGSQFGFFEKDLPLFITTRVSGDRVKLGNITKKVSRIFIDEKIPKSIRDNIPIIRDKEKIMAVLYSKREIDKRVKYDYYIKLIDERN